jgi:DNA end-binding protein Ku
LDRLRLGPDIFGHADEGYVVLRDALAKSKKMAIGQLIMHGREHLVGVTAHKMGLMLVILRYQDELRKPETFFDNLNTKADDGAVKLAVDLIQQESGKFEPQKMPNEYARAIHELVQAKIEQRAPEVEIEAEKREAPKVVNIMDALKKSMQVKGQTKVRDAVRRRTGKEPASEKSARPSRRAKPMTTRRSVH